MIDSREEYKRYLREDADALEVRGLRSFLLDDIWRFQRSLRRVEYTTNCRRPLPLRVIARARHRRFSRRLGFTIPPNVFGPALAIAHYGTIVINPGVRVGNRCRLHVGVNIGVGGGFLGAPRIGDNCFIGPGAKLFGDIVLGDNIMIGANAVVQTSHPEGGVRLGGIPAAVISDRPRGPLEEYRERRAAQVTSSDHVSVE